LSIVLEATGKVKKIRTLKPTVFWPQPAVDSSMISFIRKQEKVARITNMELFERIVDLFMGHRRKTLLATSKLEHEKLTQLRNWPEIFEKCPINPSKRPENLRTEEYIALANAVN
jgi:16S rRNA A1518/A1519 N6-dimethyltransferase RsmA/KsgA/DIM1 with predicted DNA glycosylase/AP lyase activity